jgi:hypothetical protein
MLITSRDEETRTDTYDSALSRFDLSSFRRDVVKLEPGGSERGTAG